jgi:hypothetical protein
LGDTFKEQASKEYGCYLSLYNDETKDVRTAVDTFKLYGKVGNIDTVIYDSVAKSWTVVTDAGYWRKANQIHQWFVDKCQDGIDECQDTPVDEGDLTALLDDVLTVLGDKSLAPQILPSQSGFFFGGTEYDKWYFTDLRETRRILRQVLKPSTLKHWALQYHSSW